MNAPASRLSSDERVALALAAVGSVSPQEAFHRLRRDNVVVIDVRDAVDWREARIPGAINAPRGMLEFYIDPASSFHLPVFDPAAGHEYLFCCGSGARAALSAKLACEMGLKATCIAGGMREWHAAALPLENSPTDSSTH